MSRADDGLFDGTEAGSFGLLPSEEEAWGACFDAVVWRLLADMHCFIETRGDGGHGRRTTTTGDLLDDAERAGKFAAMVADAKVRELRRRRGGDGMRKGAQ